MIIMIIRRIISMFLSAGIASTIYLAWWWVTPIWKYHLVMADWNAPIILVLVAWAWFVLSSLFYHRVIKFSEEKVS